MWVQDYIDDQNNPDRGNGGIASGLFGWAVYIVFIIVTLPVSIPLGIYEIIQAKREKRAIDPQVGKIVRILAEIMIFAFWIALVTFGVVSLPVVVLYQLGQTPVLMVVGGLAVCLGVWALFSPSIERGLAKEEEERKNAGTEGE